MIEEDWKIEGGRKKGKEKEEKGLKNISNAEKQPKIMLTKKKIGRLKEGERKRMKRGKKVSEHKGK